MKPETICVQAGYTPKNGEPRVMPYIRAPHINMIQRRRWANYSI